MIRSTVCGPHRVLFVLVAAGLLLVVVPRGYGQQTGSDQGSAGRSASAQTARSAWRSAPIRDPDHLFSREVTSWWDIKWRHVVQQQQDYSCGAAALATIFQYLWGDSITENQILRDLATMLSAEEIVDRVENGLTITDLRRVAVRQGYSASLLRLSFTKLAESKVPVIVGITSRGHDHFVVYRGTDGRNVYLADSIRGNIRVEIPQFIEEWQKNTILVVAKPGAQVPQRSPLSITRQEIATGWTNEQHIRARQLYVRPPIAFPASR